MNHKSQTTQPLMKVGEEPRPLMASVGLGKQSELVSAKPQNTSKAKHRFAILNAFTDMTMKELGRAEMAVWLLLYRDTKPNGLARTAQADLARRTGTTTRTVERAVNSLERRGLLTVVRRGGLRRGPSSYRVHALTEAK